MGTLNAIYVKVTVPEKVRALLGQYATAYFEPGLPFYAIDQPRFNPPEAELASLSVRLDTDVLWLGFQSAVDAFQFHHWWSGQHTRALIYGCFDQERTWDRVEGKAEAWERAAIFAPDELARILQDATEEEAEELKRVWRDEEIMPGRFEPSIDARETARKVAEFYRLPGWDLD
jgi:hypothetical protein